MTNIQLAELFLLRLYDTAEAEGHGKQLLLNKIATEFGISDIMKVHHVARFLEGRGLIQGRHGLDGGVRATITGEGAVFVERGGETGVMREYRERPGDYLNIDQSTHFYGPISDSNVAVHSTHVDQSSALPPRLEMLLSEMVAGIRADTTLSERHRNEHLNDASILRAELQRQQPRRKVIDAMVSHLGDVASITSLATQLQQYLPQILGLGG